MYLIQFFQCINSETVWDVILEYTPKIQELKADVNSSIQTLYGKLNETQAFAENMVTVAAKAVDVQLEVLDTSVKEAEIAAEVKGLDIDACTTQEEQAAQDVTKLQLEKCFLQDEFTRYSERIANLNNLYTEADTIVLECFSQDDDTVKDPEFLRVCIKSSIDNVRIDLSAQFNQIKKDLEENGASVDPCVLQELAEIDMDILQIVRLFFVCVNIAESEQVNS